uniref:cupin domain-containing protein n=1 Tax=Algoriphagus halophilus TaxID=226505 RepID=UPI004037C0B0
MKNPLKKSRIPDSKVFVVQELIAPYFDKNWHFHPEYQLVVILKGRGTRYIGDHIKPFKEGDMVMTGPNLPHVWRSDNAYFDPANELDTHLIVAYFPENFLGEGIFEKEEFEDIGRLMKASARGLEITGKTNQEITSKMKKLVQLKGSSQLIQLLEILNHLSHSKDISPITNAEYINLNKESEKDRMGEVYEYVMKNYKEKIMLEEVAALANLSVSAFSRFLNPEPINPSQILSVTYESAMPANSFMKKESIFLKSAMKVDSIPFPISINSSRKELAKLLLHTERNIWIVLNRSQYVIWSDHSSVGRVLKS